jgi:hypothetical protein
MSFPQDEGVDIFIETSSQFLIGEPGTAERHILSSWQFFFARRCAN